MTYPTIPSQFLTTFAPMVEESGGSGLRALVPLPVAKKRRTQEQDHLADVDSAAEYFGDATHIIDLECPSDDLVYEDYAQEDIKTESDLANDEYVPSEDIVMDDDYELVVIAVPFFWSRWEAMKKRLGEFKEIHGHCNVPWDYEDQSLFSWVSNQRSLLGPSGEKRRHLKIEMTLLYEKRTAELTAMGFEFQAPLINKQSAAVEIWRAVWDANYNEVLKKYYDKDNPKWLEKLSKENRVLYKWLTHHQIRRTCMDEDQLKLLVAIGYNPDTGFIPAAAISTAAAAAAALKTGSKTGPNLITWYENYVELVDNHYKEDDPEWLQKVRKSNRSLYAWGRKQYTRKDYPGEMIALLAKIGIKPNNLKK